MGDWCVIQDGGVADRYDTREEAEIELPSYVEDARIAFILDPVLRP